MAVFAIMKLLLLYNGKEVLFWQEYLKKKWKEKVFCLYSFTKAALFSVFDFHLFCLFFDLSATVVSVIAVP